MPRSLPALLLPALLPAVVLLSGCSAADAVLERVQGPEETSTPTASIAVVAPLSGGQTRVGTEVVAAVEQAVADSGGVPGWDLQVEVVNLAGDDRSSEVADLLDEDDLVAVVTGFGPDDVRAVVPVLDVAGVSVLSPADTDLRHFRGADPVNPLRPWSGYSTVAVDPNPEQSALAGHLVRALGVSRVLVVVDGTSPAQARAATLVDALGTRGLARVRVLDTAGRLRGDAASAVAQLPPTGAVVVDGPLELAAQVAAARPAGSTLALMTRQDVPDEQAEALDGALAPDRGLDPRRGSTELQALLTEGGQSVSAGPYGPAAYDGARLVVDALTRCLPDPSVSTSPSRSACRAEVAGTQWSGLTGPIAFDEFGARLGLLPTVVTLDEGAWAAPGE